MSLYSQGWTAEAYFGSELTANHLKKCSVYHFKENSDIAITHSAKYVDDETVDVFTVSYRKQDSLMPETVEVFDNFLDAYYCGVQCINNLNLDLMAN